MVARDHLHGSAEPSIELADSTPSMKQVEANNDIKQSGDIAETEMGEAFADTETNFPNGVNLAFITLAICLAVFLVGLVGIIISSRSRIIAQKPELTTHT